ncbi:conserved hypothetical protein [Gluconacetobacter diazotrophicus PA1 5]|uniref:Uncharacterized protein n=2 Tax=Gluconacetobacter diazotrophicus TaxID=33996 RepID=A9HPS1_GLUDA|nr:YidB family protein [Gluconacetobacter diazotrophicus]ACI50683.1 conserved hypothetical protein [Gluconacetobacter diazotrophicus PA1 5]MBB2157844.1 hypothetical protein [Gluconacetobacter diazotrophicus]TWB09517.1 hypothetical protein FBZ86_104180 [Gluconacetobacter diazotrophicus]CAP56625.1 hypothetical protein GDI2682 [Gluconacetobacter diazotrophicus PA1 5]
MTNDKTSIATSAISKVSDVVTGAAGDHSGLSSLLGAYLVSTGKDGLMTRARNVGVEAEVKEWLMERLPQETSEETVTALVPEDILDTFASQTGLTKSATVQALQEQLPQATHKLRAHEDFVRA